MSDPSRTRAKRLASLARRWEQRGQADRAGRLYRRALEVYRRQPPCLEMAQVLNNLAALCQAGGDASRPERLYRQALRIKEILLPAEDPDIALTLNNLAVYYRALGRFPEARQYYERALSIFQKSLGPSHANVAAVLHNFAEMLRQEAEACDRRAGRIERDLEETRDRRLARKAVIDPRSARFRLKVQPSRIHRFGVFAGEEIPAGSDIIEYKGERVSRREAARRWNSSRTYLFLLDSYWRLDGSAGGSGAEYINHCCEPNAGFRIEEGRVWCRAIRTISEGEELTLDYHFPKDSERIPCYCGAAACRGTINAN